MFVAPFGHPLRRVHIGVGGIQDEGTQEFGLERRKDRRGRSKVLG